MSAPDDLDQRIRERLTRSAEVVDLDAATLRPAATERGRQRLRGRRHVRLLGAGAAVAAIAAAVFIAPHTFHEAASPPSRSDQTRPSPAPKTTVPSLQQLQGEWRTPEIPDAVLSAAVRRAGASKAEAANIRRQHDTESGPTDRFTFKLSGRSWTQYQRTNGGASDIDGSHGTLTEGGDQFVLTDNIGCVAHFSVDYSPGVIHFHRLGALRPPCLPTDPYVMSALYEVSPFYRVGP